jgi:hypothetical protein
MLERRVSTASRTKLQTITIGIHGIDSPKKEFLRTALSFCADATNYSLNIPRILSGALNRPNLSFK